MAEEKNPGGFNRLRLAGAAKNNFLETGVSASRTPSRRRVCVPKNLSHLFILSRTRVLRCTAFFVFLYIFFIGPTNALFSSLEVRLQEARRLHHPLRPQPGPDRPPVLRRLQPPAGGAGDGRSQRLGPGETSLRRRLPRPMGARLAGLPCPGIDCVQQASQCGLFLLLCILRIISAPLDS